MAKYIDCFIIPVTKKGAAEYCKLAKKSAKLWIKHGALECSEGIAEDAPKGKVTSFPRSIKMKATETVVVTQVVYRSRAHRDQVMDKTMNDPEMHKIWEKMPIDSMRMIFGGFEMIASEKTK